MVFNRKTKWYILVEDKTLGPFTIDELKKRGDITPFTKVKKKGEDNWVMAANVIALRSLFHHHKKANVYEKPYVKDVIALPSSRFSLFLWLLLLFFVIVYLIVGYYARF